MYNTGKGIAIAGIWIATAIMSFSPAASGNLPVIAIFAFFATMAVAAKF